MTELTIKLTGEIQDSNFDEWKKDLIKQIKATPTELSTDDEYAAADDQVKQFKTAEKALKKAKQSALEQAGDIQTLFDAIDEVSAETREIRLTLERQIKARKKQIKADSMKQGMAAIKAMIASQSADFKLIDHSEYLNKALLEGAVKGRSSLRTMEKSVTKLTNEIAEKIRIRAELVAKNADTLKNLDKDQQAIFQDRDDLLALSEEELASTITERLEVAGAETKAPTKPKADKADDFDIDFDMDGVDDEATARGKSTYQITIQLSCEKEAAESIQKVVTKALKKHDEVESITLSEQNT